MNVAHGEVFCAAALASELANRVQEDLTWYVPVLAVLLVTMVVMLRHR